MNPNNNRKPVTIKISWEMPHELAVRLKELHGRSAFMPETDDPVADADAWVSYLIAIGLSQIDDATGVSLDVHFVPHLGMRKP